MPESSVPTPAAVFAAVRDLTAIYGYPPTVRELQGHLAMSTTSMVVYKLTQLRKHGCVDWRDGKSRTLRVLVADVPDALKANRPAGGPTWQEDTANAWAEEQALKARVARRESERRKAGRLTRATLDPLSQEVRP